MTMTKKNANSHYLIDTVRQRLRSLFKPAQKKDDSDNDNDDWILEIAAEHSDYHTISFLTNEEYNFSLGGIDRAYNSTLVNEDQRMFNCLIKNKILPSPGRQLTLIEKAVANSGDINYTQLLLNNFTDALEIEGFAERVLNTDDPKNLTILLPHLTQPIKDTNLQHALTRSIQKYNIAVIDFESIAMLIGPSTAAYICLKSDNPLRFEMEKAKPNKSGPTIGFMT